MESVEKEIRDLDCYHGFLPREDCVYLLKNVGDYICRVTELDEKEHSSVIITVCSKASKQDSADEKKTIKHVIVKRGKGDTKRWFLDEANQFETFNELIQFYATHLVNVIGVRLSQPIKRMSWECDHATITIAKILGQGEFGEVHSAHLERKGKLVVVALKSTKGNNANTKTERGKLMAEARFMRYLIHPNIVRSYGIAVLDQPAYIVLEFVGDCLEKHLHNGIGTITEKTKKKYCFDSACGLEFLHLNQIIHRDIAARNCLLQAGSDNPMVKISDFGISKTGTIYKMTGIGKLPIKWMSREAIKNTAFTAKTDTWSYGILVCEIFGDGFNPWENKSNGEVREWIRNGKLFEVKNVPAELSGYLTKKILCFNEMDRASMTEVTNWLEDYCNLKRPEMDEEAKEAAKQLKEIKSQISCIESLPPNSVASSLKPESKRKTLRNSVSRTQSLSKSKSAMSRITVRKNESRVNTDSVCSFSLLSFYFVYFWVKPVTRRFGIGSDHHLVHKNGTSQMKKSIRREKE